MSIRGRIEELSDEQAVQLLVHIIQTEEIEQSSHLDAQVVKQLEISSAIRRTDAPTDGDLARAALHVLADDPKWRDAFESLVVTPPPPQRFFVPGLETAIGAPLLVYILLKTRFKIHRHPDGKWEFLIDKPSMDVPSLGKLIQLFRGATGLDVDTTLFPGGDDAGE